MWTFALIRVQAGANNAFLTALAHQSINRVSDNLHLQTWRLQGKGESQNDTPTRSFQRGFYSEKKTRSKTNDRKLSSCRCDSRRQSRKASEIHHVGIFGIFFSLWHLQLLSVSSSPSSSFRRLVITFCKDSSRARFQWSNYLTRDKITWQNKFGRATCQWASWHRNLHFSSCSL